MAITNRNQLIREVYQLLNKEGYSTFKSPREYR